MKDFHFYTPTEVVFGVDSENALPSLVKKYGGPAPKVMIVYGGGSAVRSGLIARTESALADAGIACTYLPGVQPNPRLSLVYKGIEQCRAEGVTMLLAVGGGSVIDTAKAIAYGMRYDGDVWDLYCGKGQAVDTMPVGCILTIPAAGSEMSDSSVISNEATGQKLGYSSDVCRLRFAIMNPALTMTLPPYQTACGAVDIMMHTMERYFTVDTDMDVNTALAEALLRTVREAADAILLDGGAGDELRHRAALMWASSLSHNDLTGVRAMADFATHKIEHELSAAFDVAHGAGLAAVWPAWAQFVIGENPARFARFAVNVMGCEHGSDDLATGLAGIEAVKRCFSAWGMPVNIPQLLGRALSADEIHTLAYKCTKGDSFHPGYFKKLSLADVSAILTLANQA